MAAYTVYLDQVFLGNMVMNYAILWASSKFSRTPARQGRLVAGAALGAVYALALFVPESAFLLSVWFKIAASVLIIAVAFAPIPCKKFLACLGCFYLASFALGGLTLGMIFFIHSGQITSFNGIGRIVAEHFWPGTFLALFAFWVAGKGFATLLRKGLFEHLFKMALLIISGGEQVRVEALLDTGNQLKDPLTGYPVVVVEYTAIKTLLPAEVQACFEREGGPDVWVVLGSLGENRYASRFSAIPFQSLGRVNGVLVGFRPDQVVIERQGQQVPVGKVMVAIYHKKLDPEGSYRALLSPDLLEPV